MFTAHIELYSSDSIQQMEYTLPLPSLSQWDNAVEQVLHEWPSSSEHSGHAILVGIELIYMGKYRKDAIHHEYMIQIDPNTNKWRRMIVIYSERDCIAPYAWTKSVLHRAWKGMHCYPMLESE